MLGSCEKEYWMHPKKYEFNDNYSKFDFLYLNSTEILRDEIMKFILYVIMFVGSFCLIAAIKMVSLIQI